jgi:hypothetical protein
MVLIVDQFEETFTLCEREETRTIFLKLLTEFVRPPSVFRRVILTMRSEFETWVARDPEFYSLFAAGQIRMAAMNQEELRRAIEEPAKLVGLRFDPGVVDALLHDTLGEPASLPMLQFALLKLWYAREHNRITLSAYEKLGGARLALANSANEFYSHLTQENQGTARRILLRMVRVGDGLEVHSQRVKVASLYDTGEDPNRIDRVVDELVRAHLVRITGSDSVPQIEVAHEALIRNWPTLLEWIQKKRTDLLTRRRLNEYAAEWERRNRSDAGLLDTELLPEAERWIKSDAAREFGYNEALPALIEGSRTKQTEETKRQAAETEARQKIRFRLALVMFLLGTLSLLLGALSFVLGNQSRVLASRLERSQKAAGIELAKSQKEVDAKAAEVEEKEKELAGKQAEVNYLVKQLNSLEPPRPSATPADELTIQYSGTTNDQARIKRVLDKLRLNSGFGSDVTDLPVNALLYGSQVSFDTVKNLACALIDGGVSLRAVEPDVGAQRHSETTIQIYAWSGANQKPVLTCDAIRNLKSTPAPDVFALIPVTTPGATVLIFFAGADHRQQAEGAFATLTEVGYSVSKPSDVQPWERFAPENSEIRYFRRPTDKAEAYFISKLLESFDPGLQLSYVYDRDSEKREIPAFEIWFGRNTAPNANKSHVPSIPRIFIRSGQRSLGLTDKLKAQLEESHFWARVSQRAATDLPEAEIQFYDAYPDDGREATYLIALLKKLGISPIDQQPRAISTPRGAQPRHFELLLP